MAAMDFPTSPAVGQIYTAPAGGPTYVWNGTVWNQLGMAAQISAPRNRIVNGAMQINQAAAGLITITAANYAVDQWTAYHNSDGTVTMQQVDGPVGAAMGRKRLQFKVTVVDAALAATQYFQIIAPIEGLEIADLLWGTSAAATVTLRLGVKFPAGTYGVALMNSAGNRCYVSDMVIAAGEANTDVVKTFVIPGDVTGTWLSDTGQGISLRICLGTGTTYQAPPNTWTAISSAFGTANTSNGLAALNTFELFDVGLYKGTTVPAYEVPSFADELRRCKRYFQYLSGMLHSGYQGAGGGFYQDYTLPVEMRITPTVTFANQGYSNASAFGLNTAYPSHVRVQATITAAGFGWAAADVICSARYFP